MQIETRIELTEEITLLAIFFNQQEGNGETKTLVIVILTSVDLKNI